MKRIIDFIHHLFIPKETNNYKAKALHTDFLTLYLIFALFLTFTYKHFNLSNVLGFATDISVNKLYDLTNNERVKNSLPALTYNDELAKAAYLKAQDMFTQNYWAHYGPNGTTPWDFISKAGYKYEYAGENLAKNFLFSQGVLDGWMNSTTHKKNILRKDYSEVGFAVVNGTLNNEPTTLVVQMFGKPLAGSSNIVQLPFQPKAIQAEEPKSLVNNPASQAIPNVPVPQPSETMLMKNINNSKSLFNFPLNLNYIFMAFLLISIAFDFYFATKYNIIRIGGKNIAHFIFIGFIFIGLLLFTRGAIV